MRNRFLVFYSLALLAYTLFPLEAQAFKWRNRRQSTNVIDVRQETKAVNAQKNLEDGRRYLVAMMIMAEKDALEQPDCATLSQEAEKLKTVRVELESMGTEPVRRLICADEPAGSRINLCARAFAKDPSSLPAAPDLGEFEDELLGNYGPAMEQVGRIQAAISAKRASLAKEDAKCRSSLILIEKKSEEVIEAFNRLQQMIEKLSNQGN